MAITALVFDAYGTIYDPHSILDKAEELCPKKGSLISQLWRLKQLEYTWLQALLPEHRDFAFLTKASLDFALHAAGVTATDRITSALVNEYVHLAPFPDSKDALSHLKSLGRYKLAILSNGTDTMLKDLVRNSGLDGCFDAVISVDGAQKFKPHPDCYALVDTVLGVPKEEVLFVSSNGFDVTGAKSFGFKVAWIRRGGGASAPGDNVSPAEMYRLLRGHAERLGYKEDFTLLSLAELPTCL